MSRLAMAAAACLISAPVFAGDLLTSLAGRWPFEIAADKDFRKLAGERLSARLEPLLETGPRAELTEGRWLVVEGCRPHACDQAGAFVVVDGKTGRVWGWLTTSGQAGVESMGNPASEGAPPPRQVALKLDGWRARLSARGG